MSVSISEHLPEKDTCYYCWCTPIEELLQEKEYRVIIKDQFYCIGPSYQNKFFIFCELYLLINPFLVH